MKTTLSLMAAALLLLSGCRQITGYSTVLNPSPPRPDNLPQIIDYQGERYTLSQWNGENAEYYRAGEQGYAWKKLITVVFPDKGTPLADFAQAMQAQLARENALNTVALQNDALHIRVLYPPQPGHPHFSGYESNLMHYRTRPCGIVGIHYAEQYPADSDAQALFAALQDKQSAFTAQAAAVLDGIRCP